MKLKFEELNAKNTITIPEEHINYFSEKTLRLAKKEIMNILNVTEVSTEDIEEFIISDIFETTKELGVLKEQLFTCLPADGEFAWRVICDENIVAIDSYIVDGEENELKPHATLKVVFSEEAINIYKYLTHYNFNLELNLGEEAFQKVSQESPNFFVCLNTLRNKQILSKTIVTSIENSYIKLIEDLTVSTNGYIVYKSQIHTIVKAIGSYFMWTDFKYSSVSSEYIKDYIKSNMLFISELYPIFITSYYLP